MIIVADENIDYALIKELRQRNLQVISIQEENSGINDYNVLDYAFKKDAQLITEDKDFGELAYRLKMKHNGILLLRLSDIPKTERIELSLEIILEHHLKLLNHFSVLTKNGLRIR